MNAQFFQRLIPGKRRWWLLAVVALAIVGLFIAGVMLPQLRQLAASPFLASASDAAKGTPSAADGDDHDKVVLDVHGGAHADHAGHNDGESAGDAEGSHDAESEHVADGKAGYDHPHDESGAIQLSEQARKNIGLRMVKIELKPFERKITVPGMVVERPGWSVLEITAPMTGVVTKIYPIQGEAVEPGQPLFEVRLTHEDLVQVQTEFLRTLEELDVTSREVARLEKVTADGAVAGKTFLERKYEQQKLEADLRAQRQALLLHGLSPEQVDEIVARRTLLQSVTIRAPAHQSPGTIETYPLQVQQLSVSQGKYVNTGDTLCTLVDYGKLYIEGQAFEQDIRAINQAASMGAKVSAVLGSRDNGDQEVVPGLGILYLSHKVDSESRTFRFYVEVPNRLLRDEKTPAGRRFVDWQFKPGQRTELRVPVERWNDRIVLPSVAVVQEGAEAYVFEANGDHFDRRPVHIEYRDRDWVVIAHDGTVKVGTMVAASAAYQLQLALKVKSGSGVDPHAGHNH